MRLVDKTRIEQVEEKKRTKKMPAWLVPQRPARNRWQLQSFSGTTTVTLYEKRGVQEIINTLHTQTEANNRIYVCIYYTWWNFWQGDRTLQELVIPATSTKATVPTTGTTLLIKHKQHWAIANMAHTLQTYHRGAHKRLCLVHRNLNWQWKIQNLNLMTSHIFAVIKRINSALAINGTLVFVWKLAFQPRL